MIGSELKDILENPDLVFVFGFVKNDRYYVHPVVVQGAKGAHGATVGFKDREDASSSVETLMDEIEAPIYTWGQLDPRTKRFRFTAIRSEDGSTRKDGPWEKTDGEITFDEVNKMFAGGEMHEDLIAMMNDMVPPGAIDSEVLEVMVEGKNGGDIEEKNIFITKTNDTIN